MKKTPEKNPVPTAGSRVLFGDFAVLKYQSIVERLSGDGITAEAVTAGMDFLEKLGQEHYDLGVINLLLGGIGPFELVKAVRERSKNPNIKILVISKQATKVNIQNVIQAGASDFIPDGTDAESLYYRIRYHLSPKTEIEADDTRLPLTDKVSVEYLNVLLEASEKLSRTDRKTAHESCVEILRKIASLVDSNRTSLIMVEPQSTSGMVLAASDDASFHDFPVNLIKYPEVLHVVNTGQPISIQDVSQNALTKDIQTQVRSIKIGSIMVFPVYYHGEIVGVLNIRRSKSAELPQKSALRILHAIAATMAAHSNVKVRLKKIYQNFNSAA